MLAERPFYPQGHKLAQGKIAERFVVYFVPDCPSFGRWTSRTDAEEALPIWAKTYQCQPRKAWQAYCISRGWKTVEFI